MPPAVPAWSHAGRRCRTGCPVRCRSNATTSPTVRVRSCPVSQAMTHPFDHLGRGTHPHFEKTGQPGNHPVRCRPTSSTSRRRAVFARRPCQRRRQHMGGAGARTATKKMNVDVEGAGSHVSPLVSVSPIGRGRRSPVGTSGSWSPREARLGCPRRGHRRVPRTLAAPLRLGGCEAVADLGVVPVAAASACSSCARRARISAMSSGAPISNPTM